MFVSKKEIHPPAPAPTHMNMPVLAICISLLGYLVEARAFAAFSLNISAQQPWSEWEKSKIEAFLRDAEKAIPDAIKKSIDREIEIEFGEFKDEMKGQESETKDQARVQMIAPCEVPPKKLNAKNWDTQGEPRTLQTSGEVVSPFFGSTSSSGTIRLNKLLLNEIFKGPEGARKFSCGHRNF
ncbi:MAG: hypothetical protein AABZ55_11435 [Bdellovibrionota bacterium]